MASSTMMPMASTNANSEMVLIARSNTSITASVPDARDEQTEDDPQSEPYHSRNSANEMNTRRSPSTPFLARMSARSE